MAAQEPTTKKPKNIGNFVKINYKLNESEQPTSRRGKFK